MTSVLGKRKSDDSSKESKFRLNSKQLFLTYPQTRIESREEVLELLKKKCTTQGVTGYVIAREEHMEKDEESASGLHYHAYIELGKKCDWSKPDCLDLNGEHGNYQGCRNKAKVLAYCTKEDKSYLSSFDVPSFLKNTVDHKKRDKNVEFLRKVEEKGLPAMVKEGDIHLSTYHQVRKSLNEYKLDTQLVKDLPSNEPCGLWLQGPKGSGKTTLARTVFGEFFQKSADRWWEGYKGQKTVVLDDMDCHHSGLARYFKIWADYTVFFAEDKGTTGTWARPELFIVTSQHSIEDCFKDCDPKDVEAIQRRFKVVQVSPPQGGWPALSLKSLEEPAKKLAEAMVKAGGSAKIINSHYLSVLNKALAISSPMDVECQTVLIPPEVDRMMFPTGGPQGCALPQAILGRREKMKNSKF